MLQELLLQGMQPAASARPSMVSILRPAASTASIRQEQTSRPSTITLQAPQSPEPQPSLRPGEVQLVAQGVQQGEWPDR